MASIGENFDRWTFREKQGAFEAVTLDLSSPILQQPVKLNKQSVMNNIVCYGGMHA